jgi:hypothetical protein
MGDIYSSVMAGAASIGLVDGVFEGVPSVWHKEILFALSRGVRVVAGASMGALRAAETHVFGTEGVGSVFEWYRDGVLEDDDEVAVVHGPATDGFRPLSDAMVSLRWGLGIARQRAFIADRTHDRLVAAAKIRHYPERSWRSVMEDAVKLGTPKDELERLRRFVALEKPDLKRKDAVSVLRQLRRPPAVSGRKKASGIAAEGRQIAFEFEPTEFWNKLVDSERLVGAPRARRRTKARAGSQIRLQQLLYHTMLSAPDREDLRVKALDLSLRSAEMDRRRLPFDDRAIAKALRGTAAKHRLMATSDRRRIAELLLAPAALIPHLEGRFVLYMQLALASAGRLSQVVDELQKKQAFLQARGTPEPSLADTGLASSALLRWYEQRFGHIGSSVSDHARSLGFASEDHFLGELAAEYLFDRDVRARHAVARGGPRRK